MIDVQVCKSCLKDCELKPKKFRNRLREQMPDAEISLTSCLKVCPKDGVAFAVRIYEGEQLLKAVRTFVRPPSVENVLKEILSLRVSGSRTAKDV